MLVEANKMTKELILIERTDFNGEKINSVSARELWVFLKSRQQFTDWIKDRIKKYEFIENTDFIVFHKNMKNLKGGRPSKEYMLSMNMAKELAMVENNFKGRQARKYFIECEQKLKQQTPKTLTSAEMFLQSAQFMVEQEQKNKKIIEKQTTLEKRIDHIENNSNQNSGFYTILAYARINQISIPKKKANILGRYAAKTSRDCEYEIGKVSDERYGEVNAYHTDILEFIFEEKGLI